MLSDWTNSLIQILFQSVATAEWVKNKVKSLTVLFSFNFMDQVYRQLQKKKTTYLYTYYQSNDFFLISRYFDMIIWLQKQNVKMNLLSILGRKLENNKISNEGTVTW